MSDLHLIDDRFDESKAFIELLENISNISAIYIIGDLFRFWLGYNFAKKKLKKTIAKIQEVQKKIPVYLCKGNREFLFTEKCAESIGVTLTKDIELKQLFEKNVAITHGDIFCTMDYKYQIFRALMKSSLAQIAFKLMSDQNKIKVYKKIKQITKKSQKKKPKNITDVNKNSAIFKKIAQQHVIIHGHTHVQQDESSASCRRMVLGEWKENISVLIYGDNFYKFFNCKTNNINFNLINNYIKKNIKN